MYYTIPIATAQVLLWRGTCKCCWALFATLALASCCWFCVCVFPLRCRCFFFFLCVWWQWATFAYTYQTHIHRDGVPYAHKHSCPRGHETRRAAGRELSNHQRERESARARDRERESQWITSYVIHTRPPMCACLHSYTATLWGAHARTHIWRSNQRWNCECSL